MTEPPPPIVTVLVVTYNHASYIAAAVEGVLAQRTDFPVEILISEDASTDGTRSLVEGYAVAHPDRTRLLLSDRNIRSNEVVRRGLHAARGRYVALLDGDDFWRDDGKLQRQAAFLDAHPGCAAVFENARVARGERITDDVWTRPDLPARFTMDDIWQGNPFATCAGMMRTRYVQDVPIWYDGFFPITDWPLYILCAGRGDLAFVDRPSGVYRLHEGGLHSPLATAAKLDAVEGFYRRMLGVVGAPLDRSARSGCSRYFFEWAKVHLEAGDLAAALSCLRRSVRCGGVGLSVSRGEALQLGLDVLRRRMAAI